MKRREWIGLLACGVVLGQKKLDDGYIYDQVRMRLANDADVKGGTLDVDVKGGVVTVRGRVNTEKARAKVEKLVKKVKGVTQVVNEVKVEP
jgi:osmotically-inducible protein OsmY